MDTNPLNAIIPPQPPIKPQSDVYAVKSRLEWGEPAFTILDVRDAYGEQSDRLSYNDGHIMGAMSMPMDELVDRATSSLDKNRDIYVYGANDQQTAEAARMLRNAKFNHVSELKGGLAAWKEIGGPTEGIIESKTPAGADDLNVVSRMQDHLENLNKDV
ncbi:rhodanese-like domain-containing protein [Nodularia sp. NIES-3585]|uniref:rhodanese-like domain-containing protein n=1 Tax=Nodularia sp. NIES-3585 TaxID=1973477 RepID=UPI000B5CA07C|nr:rhodanese-like domain-containing protein [Nodularia sp. NIES-3585]GAX35218.1 rhodanese-like protein [Nodularia sp. NIES-3585]